MVTAAPLIIGPDEKAKLRQLRELTEQHPMDMREVIVRIRTAAGMRRHMREMRRRTVQLPTAFFVTFSIETGHPCGMARHLSMSVLRPGLPDRVPSPEAVWMVATEEFGFTGRMEDCAVWPEDVGGGRRAINVVQPLPT